MRRGLQQMDHFESPQSRASGQNANGIYNIFFINVSQKNDTGISALQFAAQGNQAAVITYLLDVHGFDINEVDK